MSTDTSLKYGRSRWLLGGAWLLLNNIVVVAASAAVGIILARELGTVRFGLYSTITTATSILMVLTTFRLETHLVTRLRLDDSDRGEYAQTLLAAYLLTVPVCAIASVMVVAIVSQSLIATCLVALLEVVAAPLFFSNVILQVEMRQRVTALASIIGRTVWVVTAVAVLVTRPADLLLWIFLARVSAAVAEAVLLAHWTPAPLIRWLWEGGAKLRGALGALRASVPLVIAGFAGLGYLRVDQLLVTAIKGAHENGLYAAGVRVAELWIVAALIVQQVAMPGLVQLQRERRQTDLSAAAIDALLLMLVPGGLAIALTIGLSKELVVLVFGASYRGAAPSVAVLAIADLGIFVGTVFSMVAVAIDTRKAVAWATMAGLGVNLGVNVIFIPKWGAVGAAWASVIAYAVAAGVLGMSGQTMRQHSAATVPTLWRAVVSVAIASAATSLVPGGMVFKATVGIVAYGLATVALFPRQVERGARFVHRTLRGGRPA